MNKIDLKPAATLAPARRTGRTRPCAVEDLADLEQVAARYAVAVTPDIAALIDPDDPADPIARQFIPSAEELVGQAGRERRSDRRRRAFAGLRASCIAIPTGCCSSWFTSARCIAGSASAAKWSGRARRARFRRAPTTTRSTISARTHEIWEVILTGGDPLMLSPRRLAEIMADLAAIDHVRIIRIHTRVPVADPRAYQRARWSRRSGLRAPRPGLRCTPIIRANLPASARAACAGIVDAGIPMVSQSVLLRGVNDDAATLEALMRAFVECRIKPYYLHHGDLAPGTAHLRTTIEQGQQLMRGLRGRVSGLCQPDYVLDIPGGHGKSPVGPSYLSQASPSERDLGRETRYRVVDYCGDVHLYPPMP